jgi:hypothetical protein
MKEDVTAEPRSALLRPTQDGIVLELDLRIESRNALALRGLRCSSVAVRLAPSRDVWRVGEASALRSLFDGVSVCGDQRGGAEIDETFRCGHGDG